MNKANRLILGLQISTVSFVDEGVPDCLDLLQDLFALERVTMTYGGGRRPV